MILSASRRTDIPAYYSDWFLNRMKAGYVLVRNPVNPRQIRKISLNPEVVDGIVFWTKNPIPMLGRLNQLRDYPYYFQFTLNPYGKDIETNVPSKRDVIIPAFQRLSDSIGPNRVIWRYDPIFFNETYTLTYHIRYFQKLAKALSPYTGKCTISFLDLYKHIGKAVSGLKIQQPQLKQQELLAKNFAEIARSYGLKIDTCAEGIALGHYGVGHASCIDARLFETLSGCPLSLKKDKNQRPECLCAESFDIGAYNTCQNGCRYCYANHSEKAIRANRGRHHPEGPLLIGQVEAGEHVSETHTGSCKIPQTRFNL